MLAANMLDPAMLHLPNGEFVVVDLSVLRRRLPAQFRHELGGTGASHRTAAVLWSRASDSYEQRAFFRTAVEHRNGFAIKRINAPHDALDWLQRHRAVVRWYDEDGSAAVRVSVRDCADDVLAVHQAVDEDGPRALMRAVAELSAELSARRTRRHLCAVPDLPQELS